MLQAGVVVLVVDADAAFHRHRHAHRVTHRLHAVGNQRRLVHQAGTETPRLHPIGRTAHIEVDLVITGLGAEPRGLRQFMRIAAAQLQRQWMLLLAVLEQAQLPPAHQRRTGHHFGIQPRPRRQQPVEVAAVPVGPVHHRGDADAPVAGRRRDGNGGKLAGHAAIVRVGGSTALPAQAYSRPLAYPCTHRRRVHPGARKAPRPCRPPRESPLRHARMIRRTPDTATKRDPQPWWQWQPST